MLNAEFPKDGLLNNSFIRQLKSKWFNAESSGTQVLQPQ